MTEVQTDQQLAEPMQRLGARIIDVVIVVVVCAAVYFIYREMNTTTVDLGGGLSAGSVGVLSGWKLYLTTGLISFLYEVPFTALRGQTIGKRIVGVVAIRDGISEFPGWARAATRWFVPVVMGIVPFLPLLDALWLLWDPKKQCLHDKAAGTVVVTKN